MLAALIGSSDDGIVLDRQPTSMEVIGYQRVKHALTDGTPDLKVPDNYFVRTRTQWFLIVDSDTLPVDDAGNHHLVIPPWKPTEYRKVTESGRIRGKLAQMFTEVRAPDRTERGKAVAYGWGSSPRMEHDYPKNQRVLYWRVRAISEEIETHTLGRQKATRTQKKMHWGASTQGWYVGKPFVPEREPWVAMEPMPHLQVDPPTFGYGAVILPADDDF